MKEYAAMRRRGAHGTQSRRARWPGRGGSVKFRLIAVAGAMIAALLATAGVAWPRVAGDDRRLQTPAAASLRLPALTISDARVDEDTGAMTAVFTVRLRPASTRAVRVQFATASGAASAGDYRAARGVFRFAPRERSKRVVVTIAPDGEPEDEESFYVRLSRPQNARMARAQGRGTIAASDLPPAFTVVALMDGRQQREGNPSATGIARLTFDPVSAKLSYTISVQGIGGQPTQTHLHPGEPADDGLGVLANLQSPPDNGSVNGTTAFGRLAMLPIHEHPERFYAQVHSANYFTGAIRGQFQHAREP
jgi:CHRD domain/Calx-beta domain